MENKTVRCPFCDHETKHGLGVCLPCGANIIYGKAPVWFGQIGALLSVVLSTAILICAESMAAGLGSLCFFLLLTLVLSKTIYADRVVFTR
ncbi:TPA: hypothetical protein ACV1O4_004218 [Yersinia enterocolitica]|jgi:hypothetical protein|uniref:hypothetical protein n=1 Tax=Enterobacteriaceae TaxID=543 RepID=UPI00092EF3A5|nr:MULTISPECIES: hypothetical protein [Enterobacteriaceae]EAX3713370.1 hypothetical protein [Salmonella enterica]ECQ4135711.1 hypothetical protein [Salmonella enterica subsp. enterica serovar Kentucky]EGP7829424.1 hypothetical protein [Salmonella enterica subsp. enterica serovar Infantis]EHL8438489.1 hypothetical protein [Salmonella enterica subsp. enterica serovar Javiana]EHM7376396.1 hypothetical protein [Salmonella enterica subsp. enterica serovar Albany]EHX1433177.1 hypothetical protein [